MRKVAPSLAVPPVTGRHRRGAPLAGADFKLLRSLSSAELRRVHAVQLEVRGTKWPGRPGHEKECEPLYEGQETCDEALTFMTLLGFRSNHECPKVRGWCERAMQFYRRSEGSFFQARAPP